ncbi:MAG: hypothetical protein ACTSO7_13260 [Candidatus Heimdallarchaeota archaeon]
MMRYKLLTNALLVLGISLLFILPTLLHVKANTSYPKKIELVNKKEFIVDFDSHHCEIDVENKRLFISHFGLKIFNISDPTNLELLHESPYQAFGKIKYQNGFLYTIFENVVGQVIRIFEVTNDNQLIYVNESDAFEYAGDHEYYISELIIKNNLLFTFGKTIIRCWDISDLNNITCLFSSAIRDMFFEGSYRPTHDFVGVAFHPVEAKFLLAGNDRRTYYGGEIHLFDYSNPSNISRIDFSLESFNANDSRIQDGRKNGFVSNGLYPCFGTTTSSIEVINWTDASQPIFGFEYILPSRDDYSWQMKLSILNNTQILVYNILSGIIDFSDWDNIRYITEYDGSKITMDAYQEPQIMGNYIFFLEHQLDSNYASHYYLSIYQVNDNIIENLDKSNLPYLAFLSLLLIPLPIILRKKFFNKDEN